MPLDDIVISNCYKSFWATTHKSYISVEVECQQALCGLAPGVVALETVCFVYENYFRRVCEDYFRILHLGSQMNGNKFLSSFTEFYKMTYFSSNI